MTRPADIPEDVWGRVYAVADSFYAYYRCDDEVRTDLAESIGRAIMADRAARTSAAGLTRQQAKALQFIADHQAAHGGISPSHDEIRDHLGLASKGSVCRILDCLAERGRIRRLAQRSRSIILLEQC